MMLFLDGSCHFILRGIYLLSCKWSLKRLGMRRCPQLTRVFLCEPCTNLQVGGCATGNENRIDEELPGRMRHDFWPASIRNSCDCDEEKNLNQTEQLTLWEQLWQRGRSVAGSILVLPVNLNSFENKLDLTQITLNSFFFVFTVSPIFIQLQSGCVSALERFIVIHFSHSHPVILPLFDWDCWSSPAVQ